MCKRAGGLPPLCILDVDQNFVDCPDCIPPTLPPHANPRLRRLAAPAAATLALLLGPAAGAARALDAFPLDDGPLAAGGFDLDAAAAAGAVDPDVFATNPELADVVFVVAVTYAGLMALYLWLASIADDEDAGGVGAGGGEGDAEQQQRRQRRHWRQRGGGGSSAGGGSGGSGDELPGYSQLLHAPVRSETAAPPRRGRALAAPSPRDDPEAYAGGLAGVKAALAAQAADYVAAQVREVAAVARRKIYLLHARERDHHDPLHEAAVAAAAAQQQQQQQQQQQNGGGSGAVSGSGAGAASSSAAAASHQGGGVALQLDQPGQLEALVDAALAALPPGALSTPAGEAGVVRAVARAVAARLAAAEAGEVVRAARAAAEAKEREDAAGGGGGGAWGDTALW